MERNETAMQKLGKIEEILQTISNMSLDEVAVMAKGISTILEIKLLKEMSETNGKK